MSICISVDYKISSPNFVFVALYNEKQRRLAYLEESVAMTETVKALMDERKGRDSTFTSATLIEHAGPMLKTAWTSFLSAFSIALKDNDDLEAVQLCLDGFRCAIRVSCIFGLQVGVLVGVSVNVLVHVL